jgi:phenylalanyl-tRNA synthetase alpha subunit
LIRLTTTRSPPARSVSGSYYLAEGQKRRQRKTRAARAESSTRQAVHVNDDHPEPIPNRVK